MLLRSAYLVMARLKWSSGRKLGVYSVSCDNMQTIRKQSQAVSVHCHLSCPCYPMVTQAKCSGFKIDPQFSIEVFQKVQSFTAGNPGYCLIQFLNALSIRSECVNVKLKVLRHRKTCLYRYGCVNQACIKKRFYIVKQTEKCYCSSSCFFYNQAILLPNFCILRNSPDSDSTYGHICFC